MIYNLIGKTNKERLEHYYQRRKEYITNLAMKEDTIEGISRVIRELTEPKEYKFNFSKTK